MRGAFKRGIFSVAVFVLALSATGLPGGENASAGSRYVIRTTKLERGLHYTRILDRAGPNRIKVLKVDPQRFELDVELANDKLPGRETTSSMAGRRGAIAAVNGTFGLPWGRPVGIFAEDAALHASPLVWGNAFAPTSDGTSAYIGHPDLVVTLESTLPAMTADVAEWNAAEPHPRKTSAYTPEGGRFAAPPKNACQVRLISSGPPTWTLGRTAIRETFETDEARCADEPLARSGETVLSAPPGTKAANKLMTLGPGRVVSVTWTVGWSNILDTIAGNPVLVENGENIGYECSTYFCRANPRTGVGITENGKFLLVTVDGRQPERSVGMTLKEFGRLFVKLDATSALNLDGGGSSTMIVEGDLVNRPSDPAGERDVSSAILVLNGPDEEEPVLASSAEQASPVDPTAALFDPAVTDAGSTGGLLDSLEKGVLGHRRIDLRPELDLIDDLFDALNGA